MSAPPRPSDLRAPSFEDEGGGQGQRGQDEPAIRAIEERFRLLVEAVKDYAIFMLDREGRVATWNAGAERIKGYRADEIVGRHFSRFYTAEDIARRHPWHVLEIAARSGRYEEEAFRVRKDGSRFWANVVITAMRDESGQLCGFAKVTHDLTERRRAEQERLRLAQANEAIRLRDEFLGLVSHELRTPLTTLQLQLQSLSERTEGLDPKLAHKIDRAARSAVRLAALVEGLVDLSRITEGLLMLRRERFDLAELAGEIAERYRDHAAGVGSEIVVRAAGHVWGTWDRPRVAQAIANLVSNAIKYGAGAPILIEIGLADEGGGERRGAASAASGAWAQIRITDRGPGIAEAEQARIFERFERAAPVKHFGGLGLGLYVAREIAEAHGGSLRVSSRPGEGATFMMELPLSPPARPAPAEDAPPDGSEAA